MEKEIFRTARLIGRHLRLADVAALVAVYGDAEAMRWVGDGEPLDRAQCEEWVAVSERNYRTRGYGMSALVERASGETIGFCGLVHPAGQAAAELKYAFKRAYWGRGLASEAARAMLAYAREGLGLQHAIATAYPQNLASLRVLRKAGMQPAPTRTDADGTRICCFVWDAATPPATEEPHGAPRVQPARQRNKRAAPSAATTDRSRRPSAALAARSAPPQ